MKNAARLFAMNFVQFCIIAANMRSVAQGLYLATFVTDVAICVISFTLTKRIVEAQSNVDRFAFAIGGALGAQVAIFATRALYGA